LSATGGVQAYQLGEEVGDVVVSLIYTRSFGDGSGVHKCRDIFWWNITVKQKLWKNARLIVPACS